MPREQYNSSPYLFDAGPLGHVEGLSLSNESDGSSLRYFGGLPYALPPIGPYRFRRPRPLPEYYRYGTKANPGRFTNSTALCPQPGFRAEPKDELWDEDCLQLNVYIPCATPPSSKGWPVFFYIHGGFLQWGSANETPEAIAPLLSETAFEAIVVMPAYRLNAFGFLASNELQAEAEGNGEVACGNMGFWDQRLALEWTAKNIACFGGNPDQITVGGYSAGSHSAFQQLAHELYFVPDEKAIMKRVIMWSNSPGVQPKGLAEYQKQFDEYLTRLNIPLDLPADEKLKRLREMSSHQLVEVQDNMQLSEFRAYSDNSFISASMIAHINSGDFGRRMKRRGIQLMNGECRDEHNLYRAWRTPEPTYEAVYRRLCADYPERAVKKLMNHYNSLPDSPSGQKDWLDLFGRIYANLQVHCLERGFQAALVKGGLEPGVDLLRYRFDWRASTVELPKEWEVTHATDMDIWWWSQGHGDGLKEEEKQLLKSWNEAFAAFVKGGKVQWGTGDDIREMRRLRSDGVTDIWVEDRWEEGLEIWDLVNGQDGKGVVGWLRSKL